MKDWIQLYTGGKFRPLAPRVEDIQLKDIARALSNICRYGGMVDRFYCPTPEQRVLTADLEWVPAGDLTPGRELVGFDEHPVERGQAGNKRRRFRPCVVTAAVPVRRRVLRLELSDGSTIRASEEHPWLVSSKQSGNQKWRTAGEIAARVSVGTKQFIRKFVDPWSYDARREAGWLAGIYDGEGHISFLNRQGVQMGVAQLPGIVLDEMERVHRMCGFGNLKMVPIGTGKVVNLQLLGGWREAMRLLGSIRPLRLLRKLSAGLRDGSLSKQMNSMGVRLEVIRAYDEGEQECAGLETSTRTYLCEGFGAHNSVAEHSVHISYVAQQRLVSLGNRALALDLIKWGLFHDASEAYIADVSRPVKHTPEMFAYRQIEERLTQAIADRFKLALPEPGFIRDLDKEILGTEVAQLKTPIDPDWELAPIMPELAYTRMGWEPLKAERMFLNRYNELFT